MQIFYYEIENSNWEGFGGVEGDAGRGFGLVNCVFVSLEPFSIPAVVFTFPQIPCKLVETWENSRQDHGMRLL